MNNVILSGRLTRDPELRYTPGNGKAVATFTIAVKRTYKNDQVDFVPIVAWEKQGENAAKYLQKGQLVSVLGRLQVRTYNKNDEKRYITEVIASEIDYLERKEKKDSSKDDNYPGFHPVDNDDIPF